MEDGRSGKPNRLHEARTLGSHCPPKAEQARRMVLEPRVQGHQVEAGAMRKARAQSEMLPDAHSDREREGEKEKEK